MKALIQRVKKARVEVASNIVGEINEGLLIFLSIRKEDLFPEADYLIEKISNLRIFEDAQGKMNLSALEKNAPFLIVSQFTLHGNCVKGRRPSFDASADPNKAKEYYDYFINQLQKKNLKVQTGQFQAMMDVHLINDGPVTFMVDSPNERNV